MEWYLDKIQIKLIVKDSELYEYVFNYQIEKEDVDVDVCVRVFLSTWEGGHCNHDTYNSIAFIDLSIFF